MYVLMLYRNHRYNTTLLYQEQPTKNRYGNGRLTLQFQLNLNSIQHLNLYLFNDACIYDNMKDSCFIW